MNNELKKDLVNKDYILPSWILSNYGTIKEVKDGVVIVKEGLNKVGMSEMVEFEKTGLKGLVNYLGMEKSITVLGNIQSLKVGDLVKRLNTLPYLNVNNNFLGRVVDPLGAPLDGLGEIKSTTGAKRLFIEKKAPGIIERESVRNSLETGVKFLDSMIGRPLGYYTYCNKLRFSKKFVRFYGIENLSKFKQFKLSYIELNKELNIYTKTYLTKYKDLSFIFGVAGYISLFLGPIISFLGIYIYLIAVFEFLLGFFFLLYVTYKQLIFIYNYNLNCNPKLLVKSTLGLVKVTGPFGITIFKATCYMGGSLLSINWFVENLRGVNILEEIGRNMIDDDKTITVTSDIIIKKLKNGYKDNLQD